MPAECRNCGAKREYEYIDPFSLSKYVLPSAIDDGRQMGHLLTKLARSGFLAASSQSTAYPPENFPRAKEAQP